MAISPLNCLYFFFVFVPVMAFGALNDALANLVRWCRMRRQRRHTGYHRGGGGGDDADDVEDELNVHLSSDDDDDDDAAAGEQPLTSAEKYNPFLLFPR